MYHQFYFFNINLWKTIWRRKLLHRPKSYKVVKQAKPTHEHPESQSKYARQREPKQLV